MTRNDESDTGGAANLKLTTARVLKWNVIDRFGQQIMYAVTGIVLARLLSQEDFGLVGAVLIFQAFASLMIDSGFSYALLQRKQPTRLDYSSVLWFNICLALLIYIALWLLADVIADVFDGDSRLIPLSRVMFLTFILNSTAIVQTNRLMKKMDVKLIAISNIAGLTTGAVAGIWLAMTGYGAWAIVWQSVTAAAVKSAILWISCRWTPVFQFSLKALRSYFSVGSGMMLTSFLNTLFQKIYSFFIGNRAGLVPLGYYTQSEKWSTMGVASISQVITASFLPLLSQVQDDPERFSHISSKTNRFACYLLFPFVGILIMVATPVFHTLFGTKWDPSITLFQLLLVRGIFTVLTAQYNNCIISLGKTRCIFYLELLRDTTAVAALLATLPLLAVETYDDVVFGIRIMLYWQIAASALAYVASLIVTSKVTGIAITRFIRDMIPYAAITVIAMSGIYIIPDTAYPAIDLILKLSAGVGLYIGINALMRSKIQQDVWEYIYYRFKKKQ